MGHLKSGRYNQQNIVLSSILFSNGINFKWFKWFCKQNLNSNLKPVKPCKCKCSTRGFPLLTSFYNKSMTLHFSNHNFFARSFHAVAELPSTAMERFCAWDLNLFRVLNEKKRENWWNQILYSNLHECQLKLRAQHCRVAHRKNFSLFTFPSLSLGHFVFCIALGIFKIQLNINLLSYHWLLLLPSPSSLAAPLKLSMYSCWLAASTCQIINQGQVPEWKSSKKEHKFSFCILKHSFIKLARTHDC